MRTCLSDILVGVIEDERKIEQECHPLARE